MKLSLGHTFVLTATVAGLAVARSAHGQWIEQSFVLSPGWNTVYLEVDPAVPDADAVFGSNPAITRVWTWRPPPADLGIACPDPTDPACQVSDTGWRVWEPLPEGTDCSNCSPCPAPCTSDNLSAVRGNEVYVIEASAAGTLTTVGTPSSAETRWLTGDNVVGFHVSGTPVTFETYLGPSSIHEGTRVYEMNTAGALVEITDLATAEIASGRGYWVTASHDGVYDGPLDIDQRALRGLTYGARLNERTVQFENLADAARTVTLSIMPSQAPPAAPPDLPVDAGVIPLKYRDYTPSESLFVLQPLGVANTASFDVTAASGVQEARAVVRISANRVGRDQAELAADGTGSQYQSIMTLDDGAGYRRWIAVTAEVPSRAGLYVGSVTVDHVAWIQADARIVSDDTDAENGYEAPLVDCNGNGVSDVLDLQPGTCGPLMMLCTGGANENAACTDDSDCSPGTCDGVRKCETGPELGEDCTTEEGVCMDGTSVDVMPPAGPPMQVCFGGVNGGNSCASDDDCPQGTCALNAPQPGNGIPDICELVPPDTTTPSSTTNPFSFPIIVHRDDGGAYTFLSEVTLLFDPGTCNVEQQTCASGPNEPCDNDGQCSHFVLATPDCSNCDGLLAGSIVDGQRFARRVSTAAFSFTDDLVLTGDFDSQLTTTIEVSESDRLNPLRHQFHPDHDSAGEVWDITRQITLSFDDSCMPPAPGCPFVCEASPSNLEIPGSGDTYLVGRYFETLSGLHKRDINMCGTVSLRRVSGIASLNNGS